MKFIAHRGNLSGKNKDRENTQAYIKEAIDNGYDVEVDVWYLDDCFYLGHDQAGELTSISFLKDKHLWCHAKNIQALHALRDIEAHCFSHDSDAAVLTSEGFIWTFPGKKLTPRSICVVPELQQLSDLELFSCHGICSDEIEKYKNQYEKRDAK